jgi:hypothetical protein
MIQIFSKKVHYCTIELIIFNPNNNVLITKKIILLAMFIGYNTFMYGVYYHNINFKLYITRFTVQMDIIILSLSMI